MPFYSTPEDPLDWELNWALQFNEDILDPVTMDQLLQTSLMLDSETNTSYDPADLQFDSPAQQPPPSYTASSPTEPCDCCKQLDEIKSQFSVLQTDVQKVVSLLLALDLRLASEVKLDAIEKRVAYLERWVKEFQKSAATIDAAIEARKGLGSAEVRR